MADGCGLGGSGEVDRLIRPGQIQRLMSLGGEDPSRKCGIVGVSRIGQRLGEIPLSRRET